MRPDLRAGACAFVASAAAIAGTVGAPLARAAEPPACPSSTADPYSMQLLALTGPAGADLTITVASAVKGCAVPQALKKVQLKTFDSDGTLVDTRNLKDVEAVGGVAGGIDLGAVPRDRRIEADVLVQTATPERTYVLREATRTLLRPDLVVEQVTPQQTLVGKPFVIRAVIAERNGDVGASADVTVSAAPGGVEHVVVPPAGRATVEFTGITLGTAVPVDLTVRVGGAAPAETDTSNDELTSTIDVTENELPTPRNVLLPSLVGYGAQFGMHVYAPVTPWPAGVGYGDFEQKVKAMEPQLVRIFYNDNWDGNADGKHPEWQANYDSFVKVVQLAQQSGATIDISFQSLGNARLAPGPAMAKFADVLEDLVKRHGLDNVTWAEVGNEPNGPGGLVTLDQYNTLVRSLNAQLVARGLREHIHLMGGGLVENAGDPARNHYEWMKWIAANMGDVVDAYAEHVYWVYDDSGRLEYRLRDTAHVMNDVLPPEQRKPTYMMEYGIRGYTTCDGKPSIAALPVYYRDASCTAIWRTNIAGFQQLWFDIDSAQLGVSGTSKWDAFWNRYDNSSVNNQLYWTIGPPTEGSPLTPTYYALSLLFHATAPGWQVVGVEPWDSTDSGVPTYGIEGHSSLDRPEKELAAYAGPDGELTIVGLDTHGRNLNTVSTEQAPSYSIGGLPPDTAFTLALWNATGDGTNSIAGTVTTNAAGVARFEVPLQAAFALTTAPVS